MKKTKLLSLIMAVIMAVIMVLSMLPMSVFAVEPAAPEVVSQQLNLSDDLTMRFYVKADSNTVVNATVAGVTNAYDLSTMTADENGQYLDGIYGDYEVKK